MDRLSHPKKKDDRIKKKKFNKKKLRKKEGRQPRTHLPKKKKIDYGKQREQVKSNRNTTDFQKSKNPTGYKSINSSY
jgi:hypothetical protein